jgi:hypothetical protein
MSSAVKLAIVLSVVGLLCAVAGVGLFFTGDRVGGGVTLAIGLTLVAASAVMRNTMTVNPERLPDAHPSGTSE